MMAWKVPDASPRTKEEVSDALAKDWIKLAPLGKRAEFAGRIGAGADGKTIGTAISGAHLPEAQTILNSLLVHDAALFNTLRLFGGCFVSVDPKAGDDSKNISDMLHAGAEYFDRMKDGCRCYRDTLALSDLFRPLIPAMLAIVHEADRIRSGEAA